MIKGWAIPLTAIKWPNRLDKCTVIDGITDVGCNLSIGNANKSL